MEDLSKVEEKPVQKYSLETHDTQKQRLRISVNMKFVDVYDPYGICKDITGPGR